MEKTSGAPEAVMSVTENGLVITDKPKSESKVHERVLPIHLLGSPVLRQTAIEIPEITDDIRALSDMMCATMHRVKGIGLAAPQIGVPLRIFIMQHRQEGKILRLANPVIDSTEGEQEIDEGCLSQPVLSVHMKRPAYVAVKALDIYTGNIVLVEGTELEAACLCHEIDHLNGKLICDYISRLKREMYRKKLAKNIKKYDRRMVTTDHRDHPHYTEPKH
jgi:peptide deformylase